MGKEAETSASRRGADDTLLISPFQVSLDPPAAGIILGSRIVCLPLARTDDIPGNQYGDSNEHGRYEEDGVHRHVVDGRGRHGWGGIFAVLGVVVERAGQWAWLSFLGGGRIALATADSYAELSARYEESGGAFLFLRKIHHEGLAGSLSWVLIVGYVLTLSVYAFTSATTSERSSDGVVFLSVPSQSGSSWFWPW